MKIQKRGRYRNRGRTTLAEFDLTKGAAGRWGPLAWNDNQKQIEIEITGRDRAAYRYSVYLNAPELARIVEAMFSDNDNPVLRAYGKSVATFLKEIQSVPDKNG
jgi:hypothetical protein